VQRNATQCTREFFLRSAYCLDSDGNSRSCVHLS